MDFKIARIREIVKAIKSFKFKFVSTWPFNLQEWLVTIFSYK